MFEKKLTQQEAGVYLGVGVVMGLIGLGLAIFSGLSLLIDWPVTAKSYRPDWSFFLAFFLLTGMALLAVAAISFRAYWRGIVSRRTPNGATGTAVVYGGLLGCLFLLMARHIPEMFSDEVRVLGLALLGFVAVAWVRHCIVRAEMRTAEKLIEIELRVAKIGLTIAAQTCRPHQTTAQPPPPARGDLTPFLSRIDALLLTSLGSNRPVYCEGVADPWPAIELARWCVLQAIGRVHRRRVA